MRLMVGFLVLNCPRVDIVAVRADLRARLGEGIDDQSRGSVGYNRYRHVESTSTRGARVGTQSRIMQRRRRGACAPRQ